MKNVVGYAISIGGIVVMALGFGMFSLSWPILETISPKYIVVTGIIGIIVGVFLALNSSKKSGKKKNPSGEDEIPIYRGTGKNRKVVGYRKD